MSVLETPWMADVFYLCLVLGLWTAAMALVAPGTGVLEALALLLLAAAGVGMLIWPVNPWAFLPLVLGVAAFVLSFLQRRRAGIWLVVSAILISVGSIFLYENARGGPAVQPRDRRRDRARRNEPGEPVVDDHEGKPRAPEGDLRERVAEEARVGEPSG